MSTTPPRRAFNSVEEVEAYLEAPLLSPDSATLLEDMLSMEPAGTVDLAALGDNFLDEVCKYDVRPEGQTDRESQGGLEEVGAEDTQGLEGGEETGAEDTAGPSSSQEQEEDGSCNQSKGKGKKQHTPATGMGDIAFQEDEQKGAELVRLLRLVNNMARPTGMPVNEIGRADPCLRLLNMPLDEEDGCPICLAAVPSESMVGHLNKHQTAPNSDQRFKAMLRLLGLLGSYGYIPTTAARNECIKTYWVLSYHYRSRDQRESRRLAREAAAAGKEQRPVGKEKPTGNSRGSGSGRKRLGDKQTGAPPAKKPLGDQNQ